MKVVHIKWKIPHNRNALANQNNPTKERTDRNKNTQT